MWFSSPAVQRSARWLLDSWLKAVLGHGETSSGSALPLLGLISSPSFSSTQNHHSFAHRYPILHPQVRAETKAAPLKRNSTAHRMLPLIPSIMKASRVVMASLPSHCQKSGRLSSITTPTSVFQGHSRYLSSSWAVFRCCGQFLCTAARLHHRSF